MKDFTELKSTYRDRLDFPNGSSFISNDTFDNYDEAYTYAKEESKKHDYCGFCVVFNDEPILQIGTVSFDGNYEVNKDNYVKSL